MGKLFISYYHVRLCYARKNAPPHNGKPAEFVTQRDGAEALARDADPDAAGGLVEDALGKVLALFLRHQHLERNARAVFHVLDDPARGGGFELELFHLGVGQGSSVSTQRRTAETPAASRASAVLLV